jgi:thiamine-monophosphate kinase
MPGLSEFELIDQLLKPLSAGAPGAFSLSDDAAVLPYLQEGNVHVVTKDALTIGVHMLADDPPADMARKALRVNLSDLASMGATPVGFFMALCLGDDTDESFLRGYTNGLASDVAEFKVPLMGGDVIRQRGPFTVTITAIGVVPRTKLLRRSGAQPGDSLWVSGTIGDGALGLLSARGEVGHLTECHKSALINRYQVPQPRFDLGQKLGDLASACIDISDGLIADVGHLCTASNVGCTIHANQIPLSDGARSCLFDKPALLENVLSGGDDYELAFAVSPGKKTALKSLTVDMEITVSRIGEFTHSPEVLVLDEAGTTIPIGQTGYRHI